MSRDQLFNDVTMSSSGQTNFESCRQDGARVEEIKRLSCYADPYTPWASSQIRKNCGCTCAGNAGNVFPVAARKRSRHARAVMHAGIAY